MVSTPRSSSRPPLSPAPLNWISRPSEPLNLQWPGGSCSSVRLGPEKEDELADLQIDPSVVL
jgi:hypothetical protein